MSRSNGRQSSALSSVAPAVGIAIAIAMSHAEGSPAASSPVLVVSVSDSLTGSPVVGAYVDIGKPYEVWGDPGVDPVSGERLSSAANAWFASTDSSGVARLIGFPPGERYVHVCSETHGNAWKQVMTARGRSDTLRVLLPTKPCWCGAHFQFDGEPVKNPLQGGH